MILDLEGKPIPLTEAPFKVTRQLRRAYMRVAAFSVINQKHGVEPRKLRRILALTLAKRPAFIEEVRNATKAW